MSRKYDRNLFGRDNLDTILDWINDNMAPEDVYAEEKLTTWAEDNGYVKEATNE